MRKLLFLLLLLGCQTDNIDDSIVDLKHTKEYYDIEIVDDFKEETTKPSSARVAATATASPSTIVATAEQLVTITGSGFGDVKGRVYFGNFVFNTVLEWTDTKIVTQVPLLDTGYYNVIVKNSDGSIILATANDIYVKWGVWKAVGSNGIGGHTQFPFSHADTNNEGGITFHCPIGTSESVKSTFRSALQYWTDKTGINWKLGEDIDAIITDPADGLNMLGIQAGSGIGRAAIRFTNCGDNTYYMSDSYAAFDSAPSLNVAKHEFGHLLGNGHGTGVMCSNTSCLTSEASSATLEASAYIMNQSLNIGVSCFPLMTGGVVQPPQPTLYTFYQDLDGDGYGNPNNTTTSENTTPSSGYVKNNTDCDDTDASIHPGADDIPGDGIDQDCNGRDAKTKGKPGGGGNNGHGKPIKN